MNQSQKESAAARRKIQDKIVRKSGNIRRETDNLLSEIRVNKSNLEVWDFDREWSRANV